VNPPADLIKAIRTGLVSEVVAALDAGAQVDLNDGQGEPGLPLAMACFMGHAEIVRELAMRGARVNFADNSDARAPLAMALRAGKSAVVKVLIEVGAEIPPGVHTGLTDQELMLCKWKAQQLGACLSAEEQRKLGHPVIEEIDMVRCYGTDTDLLNDEMRRAVQEACKK